MVSDSSCAERPDARQHKGNMAKRRISPSVSVPALRSSAERSETPTSPSPSSLKKKSSAISPSVDFVAAGLVSAVSKILVYPMETRVFLIAVGDTDTIDVSRLWHGVCVKGLENFIFNGLLWYLKERVRPPACNPAKPEDRPAASFIAAFFVSCAAILLVHPLSNVVVGMQGSLRIVGKNPASALEVVRSIMQSDGLGGFWKGWQMSLILRIGSATTFSVYEFVRRRLVGLIGSDASNLLAGTLGRMSEVYSCHPFKTLRSRQQQGQSLLSSWKLTAVLQLWSGVGTMAAADALKIGIRFCLIERLRRLLQSLMDWAQKPKRKRVQLAQAGELANYPDAALGA